MNEKIAGPGVSPSPLAGLMGFPICLGMLPGAILLMLALSVLAGADPAQAAPPDADKFVRDMIAAGFDPPVDAAAQAFSFCKEGRLNGMPLVVLMSEGSMSRDDPRVQRLARIIHNDLCPDIPGGLRMNEAG